LRARGLEDVVQGAAQANINTEPWSSPDFAELTNSNQHPETKSLIQHHIISFNSKAQHTSQSKSTS
jgi:hypothetical protein